MKKGITHFYGYYLDKELRAKKIKDAGFDCVITSQDPRFTYQNGNIDEQMEIFDKYGLKVSSLHNQYLTDELPNFWTNNEIGDRIEDTLKYDIMTAKRYNIKCVVVHLVGEYNEVGKARLNRVLKLCEETGVALAIENIDYQHPFVDVFENIKSPFLRFCYDSGHNNCYDPEFDYLTKYGDKLICLHLHDNSGLDDDHTLNKFGTINWDNIAQKIAKLDTKDLVLDYEMLMVENKEKVSPDEVLAETYKQACELEKMIEKYKKRENTKYTNDIERQF